MSKNYDNPSVYEGDEHTFYEIDEDSMKDSELVTECRKMAGLSNIETLDQFLKRIENEESK